jgi:hypothetical protein
MEEILAMTVQHGSRGSRWRAGTAGLLILCACNLQLGSAIFEDLSLIEVALEFPVSAEQVAHCAREDSNECQNYQRAVRAKAALLNRGTEALDFTLEVIQRSCKASLPSHGNKDKDWSRCIGGLTALYFFSSQDEDEKVLDFFKKNPSLLRLAVSELDFAWFHNRFHQERWRKLFDAAASTRGDSTQPVNPFVPRTERIRYRIELL